MGQGFVPQFSVQPGREVGHPERSGASATAAAMTVMSFWTELQVTKDAYWRAQRRGMESPGFQSPQELNKHLWALGLPSVELHGSQGRLM